MDIESNLRMKTKKNKENKTKIAKGTYCYFFSAVTELIDIEELTEHEKKIDRALLCKETKIHGELNGLLKTAWISKVCIKYGSIIFMNA